ncbi:MAG: hypothetical protein BroJett014_13200 [Planctomycetota bacterium]|nr:MAG: hypothetical protein BroJett014_13200 [Planctomycetota bacterium]
MGALLALAYATALDLWRRASTRLVAVIAALFILTLRWFSAFGLGYEVVQLKELGVYTLGLFGAVAVLLFCLPRDDDDSDATESVLLVRPVSARTLSLGLYLGRLLAITLYVLWAAVAISAALAWFAASEEEIFHYRGETSVWAELASLADPLFGQWLTLAVLLAFAQPLSRLRRPLLISVGFALIYGLGFAAPALGQPLSLVLPDLARYDLTASLWGSASSVSLLWLTLHGLCWTAVGIELDAIQLRLKST